MWPFSRGLGEENDNGPEYGATDEQNEQDIYAVVTPKISHLRVARQQEQSLIDEEDGEERMSSSYRGRSYQNKSQSLEAYEYLDDDSIQNHRVIIEGQPGHLWLHRSSRRSDDESLTSRSYYTGIHTLESVSSLLTETAHKIVDSSFRFGGRISSVRDYGGTASIPNEIFNMIKNLVGAGALGLPSGVAAFANAPSALIPATFALIVMGIVFAYFFLLMGRLCRLTRAASYREVWEITMGDQWAAIVPLAIVLMASLGNLVRGTSMSGKVALFCGLF